MTVWRMRIRCWIPKATDSHSENVILTAYPLQQWLCERVSMLRRTYIACLFFLDARWHKSRNVSVSCVVSVHPSVHLLVSPHVPTPTPVVMFTYSPDVHDYHSLLPSPGTLLSIPFIKPPSQYLTEPNLSYSLHQTLLPIPNLT
jgi:hypothetical protein